MQERPENDDWRPAATGNPSGQRGQKSALQKGVRMSLHGMLTITLVLATAAAATADGPTKTPLKSQQFRVDDPDGKPVASARVKPWALRFGNAHGGWPADRFEQPQLATTDENGLTTIQYPGSIQGEPVKTVSVFIDHPDYCVLNVEVPVSDSKAAPPGVSLQRGTKLRVQAVDAVTLEPIEKPHIQFLSYGVTLPIDGRGHFQKAEGEAGEAGWHQSRSLPADASPLFVVALRDDDVPLFSRIHRWTPADPLSHLIIASLDLGVRFEGAIDPAVPRPIRNGRVVGCATTPAEAAHRGSSMVWTDIVPINEDGTFLFTSMPRDCDIQVFALCDGWRSALPDADDARRMNAKYNSQIAPTPSFAAPQSWLLSGDLVNGTVKMTPTATVRVRCLKQDGTPVVGAFVGFNPNHYIYGGGSQIFAQSYRTAEVLKHGAIQRRQDHDYDGTTDKEGWVTISNLPPGSNDFGVGGHRVVGSGNGRGGIVVAEVEKVIETTVTIEPQPD